MTTPTIIVCLADGERVPVTADRVERDRDGAVRCYADGQEIATFWDAAYAVHADHLED